MIEMQGKYIFGLVKMGSKGQIVITKDARKVFNLKEGDSLLLVGDTTEGNKGLALISAERFSEFSNQLFGVKEDK